MSAFFSICRRYMSSRPITCCLFINLLKESLMNNNSSTLIHNYYSILHKIKSKTGTSSLEHAFRGIFLSFHFKVFPRNFNKNKDHARIKKKHTTCPHRFSYKAFSFWGTHGKPISEAEQRLQDETPEHLTSNCIAITEIRTSQLGKDVINEGKIPSLKPFQLLQFIKAIRLDGHCKRKKILPVQSSYKWPQQTNRSTYRQYKFQILRKTITIFCLLCFRDVGTKIVATQLYVVTAFSKLQKMIMAILRK